MTNTYEILKHPNYYAEVVALDEFRAIEGANTVQAAVIFGNQVIVSKDTQPGAMGIFFPLECAISPDFLSGNNLYQKAENNQDTTKKGFFESKGRVRAVRFMKLHVSEGFWIPLDSIEALGLDPKSFKVGDRFQNVNGIPVCWKYVVKTPQTQEAPKEGKKASKALKKSLKTCIVEGQLAFHYDTAQARRNAHVIDPTTVLSISYKEHGTSAILGNLLLDVPTPTDEQSKHLAHLQADMDDYVGKIRDREKALKVLTGVKKWWSGYRIRRYNYHLECLELEQDMVLAEVRKVRQYGLVACSRTVVKTAGPQVNASGGFYGNEDIWSTTLGEVGHQIPKGFLVYGEIVGFMPSGAYIQKGYDYGCRPNEHKFKVYRVVAVNEDGETLELNWQAMKGFCSRYGFEPVQEMFYGTALDFVLENHPNGPVQRGRFMTREWRDIDPLNAPEKPWKNPIKMEDSPEEGAIMALLEHSLGEHTQEFLEALEAPSTVKFHKLFMEAVEHTYLEKDCHICKNTVPAEGVVIRIDTPYGPKAFKSKSYKFFELETKAADKGETNIEDQESSEGAGDE